MTNLHEASDVSATLRESDLSIRRFRGSSYDEALAAAQAELGENIRVIGADKIRRGGLGGFFATDLGVEVAVAPAAGDAGASPRHRDNDVSPPPSVSDADWAELMRRVEADDQRARGPVARRVGVDRLLEDAERADRDLFTWASDDLDVPDFLQNASSKAAGRPIADDAFGIDVSPAGPDMFTSGLPAIEVPASFEDRHAPLSVTPQRADGDHVGSVQRRLADGGTGGRRLLEDVLAAALADELPIPPTPEPALPSLPSLPVRAEQRLDDTAHDTAHHTADDAGHDTAPDIAPDTDHDVMPGALVATDEASFDVFSDIVDYEPVGAMSPSPIASTIPRPVDVPPPPTATEATAVAPMPAPVQLDPLRRPTELATIATGRLAMRLAELPPIGGGLHAEAYRVSVAVTTPDGTRIEMSTEVDGSGD